MMGGCVGNLGQSHRPWQGLRHRHRSERRGLCL
jgi:hypothetical protein